MTDLLLPPKPKIIRPTKTLAPLDPENLPLSLAPGIVDWIEEYCRQPDGPDAGEPYVLTANQYEFLWRWYQVDERGRFVWRQGARVDAKGKGKSIEAAAILLAEFLGPVRFDGFDAAGQPVGTPVPVPWVVLAALSESQTRNTYSAILGMIESSPAVDDYRIDVGLSRLLVPNGGQLMPITAASRSQEGARPTATLADEVHHLLKSNGGHAMFEVLRRNAAKARDGSSRVLATTNGWQPDEDSIAERIFKAWTAQQEGLTRKSDILFDMTSAPTTVDIYDPEELKAALRGVYADAPWIDIDTLMGEIYDTSTPIEVSRRFFLGQIVAAADAWLDPGDYDKNVDPALPPLMDGEQVTLGFDGSLTEDSTALVAVRLSDGAPFLLGLWEKEGKDWRVDKSLVNGTVDRAFASLNVVAFFADVNYWEVDTDRWRDTYGEKLAIKATTKHAVGYDMRQHHADITLTVENLNASFVDGSIPIFPDDRLRRHVLNARRRPNRWGVSFGKDQKESPHKVDALAALMLAHMARTRVLAENAVGRRTGGPAYGF